MIKSDLREAAQTLYVKGMGIRQISLALSISRNTVRKVLRGKDNQELSPPSRWQDASPVVSEVFKRCKGNVVRVREVLVEEHALSIPYSTLTRMVRDLELRDGRKTKRAGTYDFGPGVEMQHDTSPHGIVLSGRRVLAQCASLVLSYSRRLFIRYYPSFTCGSFRTTAEGGVLECFSF